VFLDVPWLAKNIPLVCTKMLRRCSTITGFTGLTILRVNREGDAEL